MVGALSIAVGLAGGLACSTQGLLQLWSPPCRVPPSSSTSRAALSCSMGSLSCRALTPSSPTPLLLCYCCIRCGKCMVLSAATLCTALLHCLLAFT